MRREKRPFVVEIKRGPKRSATFPDLPVSEHNGSFKHAETALFGEIEPNKASASLKALFERGPEAQPRRILEAMTPETPEFSIPDLPRRGRKPGSKNKPKEDTHKAAAEPKRRGRPPRYPDSDVRTVKPTPELTRAALNSIAEMSKSQPISKIPGADMFQIPLFEPPPKRKRGRPRKIQTPKFDWTSWTSGEEADAAPAVRHIEADEVRAADLPPLTLSSRSQRLRAGERWKRRLRIPAGGPARRRAQNG